MSTYRRDLPGHSYFDDSVARHLVTSTSFHEAAHALLGKMAGIEMEEVRVLLHLNPADNQDACAEGWVELDSPDGHRGKGVTPEQLPGWLIACAGGQVGQALWYSKVKPGYDFERGMAEVAGGACHDEGLFRRFAGRRPPLTWVQAQARAKVILEAKWPFVAQFAAQLYRTGNERGNRVNTG